MKKLAFVIIMMVFLSSCTKISEGSLNDSNSKLIVTETKLSEFSPFSFLTFKAEDKWKIVSQTDEMAQYSDGKAIITIAFEKSSDYKSLSEYISCAKATYEESYPDINYEMGFKNNQLKFTVTNEKSQTFLSQYLYNDEYAVTVMCGADSKKYDKYEPEFKEILNSVII